jgi:hypothetical protein
MNQLAGWLWVMTFVRLTGMQTTSVDIMIFPIMVALSHPTIYQPIKFKAL